MPTRRRPTRRDLDVRLGYAGLGVGALTFVLVLVASFVVLEVAPRVDLPGVLAGQSVVRYPALEPAPVADRAGPGDGVGAAPARPVPAQDPGTATAEPADPADPAEPAEPAGFDPVDDEGAPDDPRTPPVEGPADGPVSQALDPVVDDLTGALDAATGGATVPVTGPVGALSDDVTDLGDALLGRP